MTPFAQLALMEKSAWLNQPPGPNFNPYALSAGGARPGAVPRWGTPGSTGGQAMAGGAAAGAKKQWGVINNTWGDIAMSSIPVLGGIYMGNRAIQDFRQGNWGSGIGNALWAGLSFVPGAGMARGLFRGAKGVHNLSKATKGLQAAGQAAQPGVAAMSGLDKARHVATSGWQGARNATKTLPGGGGFKTYGTAIGASIAAPMLLDPKQPQQQQPMEQQPQQPQSFIQMGQEMLGNRPGGNRAR